MLARCPAASVLILALYPCRYHYNVANSRVEQHVDKGNEDGLYISSIACCQELWALIMDAGTGFSAQVRHSSAETAQFNAANVFRSTTAFRQCVKFTASPGFACTV